LTHDLRRRQFVSCVLSHLGGGGGVVRW
jgi:hypothetical protein